MRSNNRPGRCIVVGAGEMYGRPMRPEPDDLLIAVDGGCGHLRRLGMTPALMVGDFDSLEGPPEEIFRDARILRLSPQKDDTDMLAALKEGMALGFEDFHIYGGTGGRLDHTLANLQCLAYLSQNRARGWLYGQDTVITAITNGSVSFDASSTGTVSVFAHSGMARGVWERGLMYKLEDARLSDTVPLGVSNRFIGVESSISVEDGTLIIVCPHSASIII